MIDFDKIMRPIKFKLHGEICSVDKCTPRMLTQVSEIEKAMAPDADGNIKKTPEEMAERAAELLGIMTKRDPKFFLGNEENSVDFRVLVRALTWVSEQVSESMQGELLGEEKPLSSNTSPDSEAKA